ncbi:TlpA family protein disulfide reductase [Haloglycomyces albus]|uniref:TlpA family protein disulfide reductase n=1 Tax=Haloglycomyces albus TaxID=526067 RepID=UPI0004A4B13B|nr:TlpA disulfide reductase family protein [Haloglycomyces albus]
MRLNRRSLLTGSTLLTAGALIPLSACSTDSETTNRVNELNRKRFTTADGDNLRWKPEDRPEAPEFKGDTLDGDNLSSHDYPDTLLVVNFWGSWCTPCREEAPALAASSEKWRDEGVQFIGINIRDTPDKARAFEDRFGITYPSIDNPSGSIANQFIDIGVNPNTIPTTLLIDTSGRVASIWRQPLDADTLDDDIEKVLAT